VDEDQGRRPSATGATGVELLDLGQTGLGDKLAHQFAIA
jgi:hypothetical protein